MAFKLTNRLTEVTPMPTLRGGHCKTLNYEPDIFSTTQSADATQNSVAYNPRSSTELTLQIYEIALPTRFLSFTRRVRDRSS